MPSITDLVGSLPPQLVVLVMSALPVVELRGAIPMGLALKMNPVEAFLLGVTGSLLPIPPLLWLLEPVSKKFRSIPLVRSAWEAFLRRARSGAVRTRRYGPLGLALFVAVPIPTTGAWTAAAIASFAGLPPFVALRAIFAGSVVAGIIVTVLSMLYQRGVSL